MATAVNQTPIFQSPLNKQRRDKFLLVLTIPEVLKEQVKNIVRRNSSVNFDALQFSIYGAVAPPIEIPPIAIPYSGQVLNVTSYARPDYPHLKVSFTVDNLFNNYWVIYKWLEVFNNPRIGVWDPFNTELNPNAPSYMTDITIYGLDEYGNRTVKFEYFRAFPISLEGVNYNDRDPTEMECGFEFAYHQLKMTLV